MARRESASRHTSSTYRSPQSRPQDKTSTSPPQPSASHSSPPLRDTHAIRREHPVACSPFIPTTLRGTANLDTSPTAKRRKLDVDQAAVSPHPPRANSANMYNFTSPRSTVTGTIDLTKSPPAGRRRLSSVSKVDTSGYTGAKKLVVKNFRTSSKSNPEEYCEKITEQLHDALDAIFAGRPQKVSNEELYRGAENICKMGKASALAGMLDAKCNKHVSHNLKGPLLGQVSEQSTSFLRAVIQQWARWIDQVVSIDPQRWSQSSESSTLTLRSRLAFARSSSTWTERTCYSKDCPPSQTQQQPNSANTSSMTQSSRSQL